MKVWMLAGLVILMGLAGDDDIRRMPVIPPCEVRYPKKFGWTISEFDGVLTSGVLPKGGAWRLYYNNKIYYYDERTGDGVVLAYREVDERFAEKDNAGPLVKFESISFPRERPGLVVGYAGIGALDFPPYFNGKKVTVFPDWNMPATIEAFEQQTLFKLPDKDTLLAKWQQFADSTC